MWYMVSGDCMWYLLLHITGMKCKSNSYSKVNGALAIFFVAIHRLTLTHFSKYTG